MERLTIRNSDGTVSQPTTTTVEQVFYRLADFEDFEETVGFSLEDMRTIYKGMKGNEYIRLNENIRELLSAKNQGRLLVMPCKVGTTVFLIEDGNIYRVRIQGISSSQSGHDCILHLGGYPVRNLWGDAFGKVVFLTYEEAEAALERMKSDG